MNEAKLFSVLAAVFQLLFAVFQLLLLDSVFAGCDITEGNLVNATSAIDDELIGELFSGSVASLTNDALTSTKSIFIFEEPKQVYLDSPISVDWLAGTDDVDVNYGGDIQPIGGNLSVGTLITSHLLHFDTENNQPATLSGTATFESEILGAILSTSALGDSDGLFGVKGISYPMAPGRAWEIGGANGSIMISGDGRSITVSGFVDELLDQMRIITRASSTTVGLVIHYPINGDASDASGNDNNGIVIGPELSTDRFGIPSAAYQFDGVDDYISMPVAALAELSSGTTAFWFQLQGDFSTPRFDRLIGASDNTNDSVPGNAPGNKNIRTNQILGDSLHVAFRNNGTQIVEGGVLGFSPSDEIGVWHHFAYTSDANGNAVYINGVPHQIDYDAGSQNTQAFFDVGVDVTVSQLGTQLNENVPVASFNGRLDDVRIYERALSPSEVAALAFSYVGDINLDCTIDLLDIQPFVSLLVSGGFTNEADINQDGVVDLLDVAPFVELLTGG